MHSYADRGQKTFLISTLVDIDCHKISPLSKDLFNFYSCRFIKDVERSMCQKTFLISTLVDTRKVIENQQVKRPF